MMRTASSFGMLITALAVNIACRGTLGPSCTNESGDILRFEGLVRMSGTSTHTVVSPKSSNLVIRLTWTDTQASLGVSATITACGGHTGCAMVTTTPPSGPGGPSPLPQPWPPGVREMLVDGWRGKTYRVDITGDTARDATFALTVTYRIACES
jgi:hypothetical protein